MRLDMAAKELKRMREMVALSREDLAAMTGYSARSIEGWELGRPIKEMHKLKLMDAIGNEIKRRVSAGLLLGEYAAEHQKLMDDLRRQMRPQPLVRGGAARWIPSVELYLDPTDLAPGTPHEGLSTREMLCAIKPGAPYWYAPGIEGTSERVVWCAALGPFDPKGYIGHASLSSRRGHRDLFFACLYDTPAWKGGAVFPFVGTPPDYHQAFYDAGWTQEMLAAGVRNWDTLVYPARFPHVDIETPAFDGFNPPPVAVPDVLPHGFQHSLDGGTTVVGRS